MIICAQYHCRAGLLFWKEAYLEAVACCSRSSTEEKDICSYVTLVHTESGSAERGSDVLGFACACHVLVLQTVLYCLNGACCSLPVEITHLCSGTDAQGVYSAFIEFLFFFNYLFFAGLI